MHIRADGDQNPAQAMAALGWQRPLLECQALLKKSISAHPSLTAFRRSGACS